MDLCIGWLPARQWAVLRSAANTVSLRGGDATATSPHPLHVFNPTNGHIIRGFLASVACKTAFVPGDLVGFAYTARAK
jgi:hypothetical protein